MAREPITRITVSHCGYYGVQTHVLIQRGERPRVRTSPGAYSLRRIMQLVRNPPLGYCLELDFGTGGVEIALAMEVGSTLVPLAQ